MDNNLNELIKELADKLGTTAEKLYSVLVKNSKLEAIISFINLGVIILFYFPCFYAWQYLIPKCVSVGGNGFNATEWPENIQIMVAILAIASAALIIGTVAQIFNSIDTGIKNLINPEGAAIEKILYLLRK